MSRESWGNRLAPDVQRQALAWFVHRHTRDHLAAWAKAPRPDGRPYPVQFASDADWLEHTLFFVTNAGKLDGRHRYCESYPTWPDNPELRKDPSRSGSFMTGPALAETPTKTEVRP